MKTVTGNELGAQPALRDDLLRTIRSNQIFARQENIADQEV
jgi:hypothetical protein